MTETQSNVPSKPASSGPTLSGSARSAFHDLWSSLFGSGRFTGKSLLVCASDSGEGASTTACGLALAGTEEEGIARVALVDFNFRKPSLHKMLRKAASPGVGEVLTGGADLKSVVQKINPFLDFYATGHSEQHALDILRGERIGGFFRSMAEAYDFIMVDVAPVNHFPDAQVLAGHLDEIVLVAHSQQTPREAVAQAKKKLEFAGGKLAGVVLNMRTYPIPQFLYRRV